MVEVTANLEALQEFLEQQAGSLSSLLQVAKEEVLDVQPDESELAELLLNTLGPLEELSVIAPVPDDSLAAKHEFADADGEVANELVVAPTAEPLPDGETLGATVGVEMANASILESTTDPLPEREALKTSAAGVEMVNAVILEPTIDQLPDGEAPRTEADVKCSLDGYEAALFGEATTSSDGLSSLCSNALAYPPPLPHGGIMSSLEEEYLTTILTAYKELGNSGLGCVQTISFEELLNKAQTGEVCLSYFYSRKILEVLQETGLNRSALEAFGLPLDLPQVRSLPHRGTEWYFNQIFPRGWIQSGGLSPEELCAAWKVQEYCFSSSSTCSSKDVLDVIKAMPVGYKLHCTVRKERFMGMAHTSCLSVLLGRKPEESEIDPMVSAHKLFLLEKKEECLRESALDITSFSTRSEIEGLIHKRLCSPRGRLNSKWFEDMNSKIHEIVQWEQENNPGEKFPWLASALPEECMARLPEQYPELQRKMRARKAAARSLRLIPEEYTASRLLLGDMHGNRPHGGSHGSLPKKLRTCF